MFNVIVFFTRFSIQYFEIIMASKSITPAHDSLVNDYNKSYSATDRLLSFTPTKREETPPVFLCVTFETFFQLYPSGFSSDAVNPHRIETKMSKKKIIAHLGTYARIIYLVNNLTVVAFGRVDALHVYKDHIDVIWKVENMISISFDHIDSHTAFCWDLTPKFRYKNYFLNKDVVFWSFQSYGTMQSPHALRDCPKKDVKATRFGLILRYLESAATASRIGENSSSFSGIPRWRVMNYDNL